MHFLPRICVVLKLNKAVFTKPLFTQWRWKKIPRRKPRWLPMAPSKVFRIPEHPYVPPDENELIENLLDEYYRKVASLRVLYKEELAQKSKDEGHTLENQQKEEELFQLLLEENREENEKVRAIREDTLAQIFEEKQMKLLELEEQKKDELEEIKMKVEEIVRKEKQKYLSYITDENLDEAVEKALNTPVDVNFAIDLTGNVKWQGNPPVHLEAEIIRKIKEATEN